ncbi:MAG: DUF4838 domain-containing protein, partial [Lentisphaerota bacterium]
MLKFVMMTAFCLVSCSCMAWKTNQIAQAGKTDYVIVTGNAPTEAEKYAAEELKLYLKKITGAEFKTVSEKDTVGLDKAIYLGWTDYGKAKGIDYQSLGKEEWIIRTIDDSLIICGGRLNGTLYGVYEFLEKFGGCAWLDERVEIVPKKPDFTLSAVDERGKPAFLMRTIYNGFYIGRGTGEGIPFQVRNKCNDNLYDAKYGCQAAYFGSPGTCHTMYEYAKDWPKEHPDHPEYFALTEKGGRLKPTNGAEGGMLICLTNPEVRKLVLQKLRAYIAKDRAATALGGTTLAKGYPPPNIYSISMNDNPGHCVCPGCKAIIDREGALSGVMIDFINEIARGIKTEYPDILIHTFAYVETVHPPKHIKAEDNVIVQVCNLGSEGALGHPNLAWGQHLRPVQHEDNKPFPEVLKRWSEVAQHLSIWDYWGIYMEPQVPYCQVSFIQPDLKFYHDNKVEMYFTEEANNITKQSFVALKMWLGFKMMQNPDRPARGLIKLFMDGYYGAASNSMMEYLDYLEMRIATTPGKFNRLKVKDWQYLDLPFFVKANALLDQAEALSADNPIYSYNVRRERRPMDCALLNFWDQLESKLAKNEKMPFDRKAVIARYERNGIDIIKRYYSGKTCDIQLVKFANEVKFFKDPPPVPEQFKGKEIVDFSWPDLREGKTPDPEAAGGMSWRLGPEVANDGVSVHDRPFTIGIYDTIRKKTGPEITIKKEDIPQDGKYHWYKVGNYEISDRTYLWTGYWMIQIYLDKAYQTPMKAMDIYASVKVVGPAYVKDSKDQNALSVDRVILVDTEKGFVSDQKLLIDLNSLSLNSAKVTEEDGQKYVRVDGLPQAGTASVNAAISLDGVKRIKITLKYRTDIAKSELHEGAWYCFVFTNKGYSRGANGFAFPLSKEWSQ